MPTDISLPLRILNKGPGYLRRQMEGNRRGRLSAVERLAADKGKYVKSPQLVAGGQGDGDGDGDREARSGSEASGSSSGGGGGGSMESCPGGRGEKPAAHSPGGNHVPHAPLQRDGGTAIRRSKRQMRPDSLVIYRQKYEVVKGSGGGGGGGGGARAANQSLVRRLFQGGSIRDKQQPPPPASPEVPKVIIKEGGGPGDTGCGDQVEEERPSPPPPPAASLMPPAQRPAPCQRRASKGLHRSQSDISSRYSRAFSEFDSFFRYCGLEPEVIDDLGRENFTSASDTAVTVRVRSVSAPDSDSDFSRHSAQEDQRPLEEALGERKPASSLSVIERNARVIKWLYGCKRARECTAAELV
ncbi:protein FAM110C isoform X2 [Chiloscyllium plagiosum]|uniref:protein FAM110C isoform X2 n=1 Tax=Chiloscyllium plagiosum TaxID=36176 RepID=UPI001CB875FA|nr:protein FAM110C isoform X2 [Chiloscyllium plagiosum]